MLLFVTSAVSILAQPASPDPGSDPSKIERGLRSDSPREVAWAAWRAASDPGGNWHAQLRDALAKALAAKGGEDSKNVTAILVDSLMRTHAMVAPALSFSLYDEFPDAALALMIKNSERDEDLMFRLLLRSEEERNRVHWLALAFALRSGDFKRHLAEQVRFEYVIEFVDSDAVPVLIREGGPRGIVAGVPSAVQPFNWPGWAEYCLTDSPSSGDELLVLTRQGGVYIHRTPVGNPCPSVAWNDHGQDIVRFLHSFVHCTYCSYDTPQFPDILGAKTTLFWRSPEQAAQLLQRVTKSYAEQCSKFLGAAGYGSLTDSELRSRIKFTIRDLRQKNTVPLPDPNALSR